MDIHNGKVYVVSAGGNSIFTKPLEGGTKTKFVTTNYPFAVKWSPDGENMLVSETNTNKVHVFNKNGQLVRTFTTCGTYATSMVFDDKA